MTSKSDLDVLLIKPTHPARITQVANIDALCRKVTATLGVCVSPNGNNVSSWVARTHWEVVDSEASLKAKNLLALQRILDNRGVYILSSQRDDIYEALLSIVKAAADADWRVKPEAKKLTREHILQRFDETVRVVTTQMDTPVGGIRLEEKMHRAGMSPEVINAARVQRMRHMRDVLNPKYFDSSDRDLVEREVLAQLTHLLSELESGKIADSGVEFHNRCLTSLQEMRQDPCFTKPVSLGTLQGWMYTITDRCQHRFVR